MIRRVKKIRGASACADLAFPKGKTRQQEKDKTDREWTKDRGLCRYQTFMRARGCCEHCGRALILIPSQARHEFEIANVHEEPPRSQGGDPLDPICTVLLCTFCHQRIGKSLDVTIVDPGSLNGKGRVIQFSKTVARSAVI